MKHSITGVCFMVFFVMLSKESGAQSLDTLKARYDNQTLHFFKGYISKGQNGERIRLSQLKNEFSLSPEGSKEFALSRRKQTTALILASTALTCIVAGTIVRQNGNKDLGNGLLLVALPLDIISIPFSFSAQKKLQHSIWLRNRDVLFSTK